MVKSIFSFRSFRILTVGGICIRIVTSPPWSLRNITKAVLYRMVTEGARAEPFDRKERMATNNPYQVLVEGFARLLSEGQALSPAGLIND